jgi:succinate dehydrogenase / fumarate reductase, flavoprotein subunit
VSGDHQSKLTLMSESLRNDGRVWVPKTARPGLTALEAKKIPESERDYFLERKYPSFGNLVPRDVASRNAKYMCDEGRGVGKTGLAVFLDFTDAIKRDGKKQVEAKYGNLFDMYQQITGDNPYEGPMMIYPAVHYTMGGLWVDYNLMTSVPGLYALGEANFSDHGANRLGASALMQGLADGYFVIPYTIGDYLAGTSSEKISTDRPEFKAAMDNVNATINKLLNIKGKRTVDELHRELGLTMWNYCGMSRTAEGLKTAKTKIQELKKEFWQNVNILGGAGELNQELEKAMRVADFIELGELMVDDALNRSESCGGHFREESQTPDGEALRNDDAFLYVAAWEYKGDNQPEVLHKEELKFENVKLTQRSYK